MNRFLLFAGHHHYPQGGWSDFQGSFDTTEQAIAHFATCEFGSYIDHWGEIVDRLSWSIVKKLKQGHVGGDLSARGPVKERRP